MMSLSKMAVAPLLLSVFVIALCKPFYPLVEYSLNKSYIAQTLCENKYRPQLQCEGKCHLAKEIAKAHAAGERESKPVSPKTNFDHECSYLNTPVACTNHLQNLNALFTLTSVMPCTSAVIADIFHPPRQILALV